MIISQLTINDLKSYANVYHNEDDSLFTGILAASTAFIKKYTGISDISELDNHEDLSIALMVLSNEMYDNRSITVDNNKLNFVIKTLF
jgi:uncharacterized phage protein (predicted DNA packaging)